MQHLDITAIGFKSNWYIRHIFRITSSSINRAFSYSIPLSPVLATVDRSHPSAKNKACLNARTVSSLFSELCTQVCSPFVSITL